jgi:hypothetical protein
MGVGQLTTDFAHRGVATAMAVTAILVSANWMRRLPAGVPLTRIVPRVLLGSAAIAAVVAAVNRSWEGPATITTTALVLLAVLIRTELQGVTTLLVGVANIGGGVAAIGFGVAFLLDNVPLTGVAAIGIGVAAIGFGVAFLLDNVPLTGVAAIGGGVAAIGLGVALLLDNVPLTGVAAIATGIAAIGLGVALLRTDDSYRRFRDWLSSLTHVPAEAIPTEEHASIVNPQEQSSAIPCPPATEPPQSS